jgi:hypothetical protein
MVTVWEHPCDIAACVVQSKTTDAGRLLRTALASSKTTASEMFPLKHGAGAVLTEQPGASVR